MASPRDHMLLMVERWNQCTSAISLIFIMHEQTACLKESQRVKTPERLPTAYKTDVLILLQSNPRILRALAFHSPPFHPISPPSYPPSRPLVPPLPYLRRACSPRPSSPHLAYTAPGFLASDRLTRHGFPTNEMLQIVPRALNLTSSRQG